MRSYSIVCECFTDGSVPPSMFSSEEFATVLRRVMAVATRNSWPMNISGLEKTVFHGVCQVDSSTSWAIDWDGAFRECCAEMGTSNGILGTLESHLAEGKSAESQLSARDPFDDDDCQACVFLPACMGACPKTRASRRAVEEKECPSWKYNFQDVIRRQLKEKECQTSHT